MEAERRHAASEPSGGVGMAAVRGAGIAGAGRIIAVDNNPVKLGATDLVNPDEGDPVERIGSRR